LKEALTQVQELRILSKRKVPKAEREGSSAGHPGTVEFEQKWGGQ
jgi:hypothetical protein